MVASVLSIVACCHSVKLCVDICLSGLLITTKWCCDQDVKFVPGADLHIVAGALVCMDWLYFLY